MIKISLEHSYIKNQHKSSWIDDPFEMKGTVLGMAPMSVEHQLHFFAQELVREYGSYNFNSCAINLEDIPEDDQNNLVRLFIEYTGRELTECVNGLDFSLDNPYSCALLGMLYNDNAESRDFFAQVTRKNILAYYAQSLQDLLNESCLSYLSAMNNEQGYYSDRDSHSGDYQWSKW